MLGRLDRRSCCRAAGAGLVIAMLGTCPAQTVQAQPQAVTHALGEFKFLPTGNGVLIAAPHGTFDAATGSLAVAVASRLQSGYAVASGFADAQARINVNRPTEGASLPCARESRTARAADVYERYAQVVDTAAGSQPLRLYVEIHGNSDGLTAARIDVATRGLSVEAVQRLKDAVPALLEQASRTWPGYPALSVLVEPVDRIKFDAACMKTVGIASRGRITQLLHFELPKSAREPAARQATAQLLAGLVAASLAQR